MAVINKQGNVIAHCPDCNGGKSTYEYTVDGRALSSITKLFEAERGDDIRVRFQLFRCAGCGRGGIGTIKMMNVHGNYPADIWVLLDFYPDAMPRLTLPAAVPEGIKNEFQEAELCAENKCLRAAAALFRSVLDKTMRANGYKTEDSKNLKVQIDKAASDGIITPARQRRAHDEVRVLGNDVLHDEWQLISIEDVDAAHHYAQRILEDFYDDRASVLKQLRTAGRIPAEDIKKPDAGK